MRVQELIRFLQSTFEAVGNVQVAIEDKDGRLLEVASVVQRGLATDAGHIDKFVIVPVIVAK